MTYRVANRRIEVDLSDEGEYQDFSENVYISEVKKDLLTGIEKVIIVIEFEDGGEELVELPHKALGTRIISELAVYGFSCVDCRQNNEILQFILLESKKSVLQKKYFHQELGFVKNKNGDELFLLHQPIGEKIVCRRLSTYVYADYTRPRGSFTGWRMAVQKHVYGQGHMELALAIGAVAPIAHILLEENVISEIPLISLIGISTSGKTTSLILCSSIWYSQKMIADFNCTQNAFVEMMCEAKGLSMLVDESSAVADWDFTGLLYNLPKGQSKRRCSGDGTLQKRKNFSGAIVFTGERSFFEQTNKNRGLDARLLELTLPWTVNAIHADDIATDFGRHYGVAAVPLMTWILANKPLIKKKFKENKKRLEGICKERIADNVILRLVKIPAMILTAAYVLNCALNLSLDIDNIQKTLLDVLFEKADTLKKSPTVWHQELLHKLSDSADEFPYPDGLDDARKIWGIYGKYKRESIVWVREDIFEKWLNVIAPTEIDKAKKLLAEKELIYYVNRHYKEKKTLRGAKINCYGLYLSPPAKRGTRNVDSPKKKVNLLDVST